MVINVGALKSGRVGAVEADIHGVVAASHHGHAICKVIIETCLLTREEKIQASLAAKNAGADFVKTSTGFSTAGATPEDVRLIRETIGPNTGVKAAGGVRTLEDLQKMVEAGATRIGASAGVKIIEQLRSGKSSATPGASPQPLPATNIENSRRGLNSAASLPHLPAIMKWILRRSISGVLKVLAAKARFSPAGAGEFRTQ